MKWIIDKEFQFAYGHRVWSQELNTEYTGTDGDCLACRHLHGHQGKLKVMLESDKLESGMVTDFKHLGWFKTFIDDTLDHKFIMDIHDPLFPHECPEYAIEAPTNFGTKAYVDVLRCMPHPEGHRTPDLDTLPPDTNQAIIEKYEGMVFVDFVPTSENLSAWLLGIAQKKMNKIGVKVVAVEFWETPKSHCRVEV